MSICQRCDNLRGSLKSAAPHIGLSRTSRTPYKSGIGPALASGYMERYRCTDCGAEWMRDNDEKDPNASWSLIAETQD